MTCLTAVTGIVMILIILGQMRDVPTQLYRLGDLLISNPRPTHA